ncbi:MAG: hypothetical protein ACLU8S_06280 [Coprococcus phoceensis]
MIQDCQNRPIGVTVSEWCQEHSITTSNYYYRMAQVRKACLDSLSNEVVEQAISSDSDECYIFKSQFSKKMLFQNMMVHLSKWMLMGMKIRIHENTSSSLIQKVLGAVVHVE